MKRAAPAVPAAAGAARARGSGVAGALGGLGVNRFLRQYWQRHPLLLRHTLMDLADAVQTPPFTVSDLFALARDPDVESRLVHAASGTAATGRRRGRDPDGRAGKTWRLSLGPFRRLPARMQPGWSLLVQGVDLHLPAARALMDRFRFLPDARLDDLMISFASDGGSVGPHVDSYDVFLLQIHGRRRWRIAPPGPFTLVPDAPLRVLADFTAQQDWLLEPGDMLYLPPGWAHEGTAVGECMTCSIGFRSPSRAELRQAFFGFLSDQDCAPPRTSASSRASASSQRSAAAAASVARVASASPDTPRPPPRYRDKTRKALPNPARIPDDMAETLRQWLQDFRPSAQLIDRFIGCYLTEPKPNVWFDTTSDAQPPAAGGVGIVLDRRTRLLYRKRHFYINGEALQLPRSAMSAGTLLRRLADRRGLDAVRTARAMREPWLRDRLTAWLASGWIRHAGL